MAGAGLALIGSLLLFYLAVAVDYRRDIGTRTALFGVVLTSMQPPRSSSVMLSHVFRTTARSSHR